MLHQELLMGADVYLSSPVLTLPLQVLEARVGKGEGPQIAYPKHGKADCKQHNYRLARDRSPP